MTDGIARLLVDSSGNVVKVTQDGSDFKVEVLGKLRDAAGTLINPSKEDGNLATVKTNTDKLDANLSTRAAEATQALVKAKTDNLDVALSTRASETTLDSVKSNTDKLDVNLSTRATEASLALVKEKTDNIDVALSTRATESTQTSVKTNTDKLDVNLSTRATEATQALIQAKTDNIDVAVSTRASETTLDSVKTNTDKLDVNLSTRATEATVGSVDTVLKAIRDTAGVKIIDDIIRLGDTARNGINSIFNNAIRRLEARSSITSPDGADDVAVVDIDGVNHLAAGKSNMVDATNSSVVQLGPGAAFAPVGGTDVSQYASVAITIHSDQNSAVDGMAFEFSQNGTDWDDVYRFNLEASSSQTRRFQFPITAQYFRVNYTNADVLTTEFRVQTLLHRENILTSIHRIEDIVKEDRSAQLMKAAIIAQREGALVQDFHPVLADVSGNLKVTTIGSDIPSDPTAFILVFLENGGSENMRVDGSTTPVVFSNGPSVAGEVWSIRELLLTFAADDFEFDGTSFGSLVALTNGFSIEIIKDAVSTEIFRVKQNEDFLRVPGRTPLVNNTGPKDILGAALSFQGLVLNESTSDTVQVSVRDNLVSTKLKYLTATLFAVKVT